MQTQQLIVQALYSKFRAQRDEAQASLAIVINASVGVGDHITHVSEAENLIRKIAEAEECLKTLDSMLPSEGKEVSS